MAREGPAWKSQARPGFFIYTCSCRYAGFGKITFTGCRYTAHASPCCNLNARTVFVNSIAIVIGPTPPGTGVT